MTALISINSFSNHPHLQATHKASMLSAFAGAFKLVEAAQKRWRRVGGHNHFPTAVQNLHQF